MRSSGSVVLVTMWIVSTPPEKKDIITITFREQLSENTLVPGFDKVVDKSEAPAAIALVDNDVGKA